jgi:poly(beta-D-mannuronate) lyase
MSFGEGSDKERSQAPSKVVMVNNLFANKKDSLLFRAYDKIDGFVFAGNLTNHLGKQLLPKGITSTSFRFTASDSIIFPAHPLVNPKRWQDSIIQNAPDASNLTIQANPGILSIKKLQEIKSLGNTGTGAKWFKPSPKNPIHKQVSCNNGAELYQQIIAQTSEKLTILLTGTNYEIPLPIQIKGNLTLTAKHTDTIRFSIASTGAPFVFQIMAGSSLTLSHLIVNLQKSTANAWIATDSSGHYKHSWFRINNCSIIQNQASFFYAYKTSVADSILFSNNRFFMGSGIILNLQQENERKGLYPVEHLTLTNNQFEQFAGQIISIARPGVDESTLGPIITIRNNQFKQIETTNNLPVIHFSGAQKTYMINNQFIRCNPDKTVVLYQDEVKAEHRMERNILEGSGKILTNKYLLSMQ